MAFPEDRLMDYPLAKLFEWDPNIPRGKIILKEREPTSMTLGDPQVSASKSRRTS